jgi:outer membrane protein insertion porin family
MFYRFIFIIFLVLSSISAHAQIINKVVVHGNERVEDETIKSYLDYIPGMDFTNENLDSSIKRLYGSNLFQNVDVKIQGNSLYVNVTENPKINLVTFEGNSNIKDKELESEIYLKPRAIYTKAKVQDDVNRIIDLYSKKGRFSAKVTPQIIVLPQNRVNLVFKIEEGPVAKIAKIVFSGNKAFSDSSLKSELSSRETRWYYFLSSSDQFNPARLEYDRELLTRYYNSRGYADFKIVSIITNISNDKKKFYITFTVEEGLKYNFGEINIESRLSSSKLDLNQLKKELLTKTKELYDIRKVEKSVDSMIKTINDLGFAFVDIYPSSSLDNEKKLVNITYLIGESRKVYINKINIKGNYRTADNVIRREFRLAEGDPYNSTKIRRSEQRVNNLEYFEPTSIETVRTEQDDKVDLNLEVQEKSTSSINFAAGYSTADGVVGKIGFNETNLFGKGQFLSASIAKSQKTLDLGLSFTEPYLYGRPISGGFDIFSSTVNRSNYRPFDDRKVGFTLRSGYNITENLSHSVSYSIINNNISNVSDKASEYIKRDQGKKINSMIGHAFTYDRRDRPTNPTDGYILSVSQDYAGIGGNTHFIRHGASAKKYFPIIDEDLVLMIGTEGGIIHGTQGKEVRLSDRFFLGGAESLRGFDSYGVGPRTKNTGDSLGGNVYYTGITELRFPLGIGKDLGLFGSVFADAGSLFDVDEANKENIWNSKKIRSAYGFGIGFVTPMGPIKLHYAIPMRKEKFDKTKNFDITFSTNF